MSNSLIPHLLSDSPPPIAGSVEEDFDDEFGDFTGPGDLSFDNESLSIPSTPKHLQNIPDILASETNCVENCYEISEKQNTENELPIKNYINILDHIESNIPKLQDVQNEKNSFSNTNSISEKEIVNGKSINEDTSNELSSEENSKASDLSENSEDYAKENIENDENSKRNNDRMFEKNVENIIKNCDTETTKENCILGENGFSVDLSSEIEFIEDCNSCSESSSLDVNEDKNVIGKVDEILLDNDIEKNLDKTKKEDIENEIQKESNEEMKISKIENEEFEEDDFGDFANFNSVKSDVEEISTLPTSIETANDDDDFAEFGSFRDSSAFVSNSELSSKREFGDFSSHRIKDDEDFDSFGDFSSFNSDSEKVEKTKETFQICSDSSEAFKQAEIILKKCFPKPESDVADYNIKQDFTEDNSVFDDLRDVTETNALKYQWGKSTAQKNILKTLNVDIRNILYGPSWNAGVPLFAANLCSTPLEPIKSDVISVSVVPSNVPTTTEIVVTPSEVPAVDFDWSGTDLTNPLDCSMENGRQEQETVSIGKSIEEIAISRITDTISVDSLQLQECNHKNVEDEDDFSDFASYQPKYESNIRNDWENNMLPLRESHISFQPTNMNENNENDINLDLFSTKNNLLESETKISEELEEKSDSLESMSTVKLKQVTKACTEEEFTDFHSSAPAEKSAASVFPEPLKPSVLQPIPLEKNSSAKIEWPAPGLDEEEVNRIVIGCMRKEPTKVPDEDDEWSDFQSVKGTTNNVKSRTSTPDLTLSVFNLGNVKPPKAPTPMVTHNGVVSSPVKQTNNATLTGSNKTNQKFANSEQKFPFITSEAFDAIYRNPTASYANGNNVVGFPTANYSASRHLAAGSQNCNGSNKMEVEDEWGDFVSAPNNKETSSSSSENSNNARIITNPRHNVAATSLGSSFNYYGKSVSKETVVRQERRNIPSISALPDMEFVSFKGKNGKK